MVEYIVTFLGIYFLCLFKFIAGPVLGYAAGYSVLEIELVTVAGMMTSVVAFTFLGEWIKRTWTIKVRQNPKKFSKRTRHIIRIWQKFGVWGIAALTPILLTPIGGTVILTSFGIPKRKILLSMLLSGSIWAFVFGISIHEILHIPFFQNLFDF
jgi:hypothetical protein